MTATLQIESLGVRFGGALALRDVSLSVAPGTIHGLVGPNGSGKTTLLNAVSGFVPSTGAIRILGQEMGHMAAHRRARLGLGRTFQNPKVPANVTGAELMRAGEHLSGVQPWWMVTLAPWRAHRQLESSRARAREMLDRLGLPAELLDQPLSSLPGGSLKLLDIARALMPGPRLLALDEPTSGLNEREIQRLLECLRALQTEGLTVLIVEHNVRMLAGLCDTITVLNVGELLREGPPAEVFASPEVVAAYLGEPTQEVATDGSAAGIEPAVKSR